MRTIDQIQTYIVNASVSLADYWTLYIEKQADGDPNTEFLKRRVGILKLYIVTIQSYIDNHPEDIETINSLFNSMLSYLPSNFLTLSYAIYNPLPDNASGIIVISSVVKASNITYGIVRLNVAPINGTDPVVLGANDPRISNWDAAYSLAETAFDARIVSSTFNSAGNLVLTTGDTSTITSSNSVILNQSSVGQAADMWITGIAKIEGQVTLDGLVDDGSKINVLVADADGNLYKRTIAEFAGDINIGSFTANKAIVSNGSGVLTASVTTDTEIGYVAGVTSAIQTQLNNKQPLDAGLTAISALSGNGLLRKSAGVWGMDTATYLTANQTITLSGDVSGSGSTAITATIANDAVTFTKMQNVNTNRLLGRSTLGSGNIEEILIGTGLLLSGGTLSGTITQYTDAMARASISETITGIDYNNTTGVFSMTAGYSIPTDANQATWTTAYNNMIVSAGFDTSNGNLTLTQQDGGTIVQDLDGRYLTANQLITLTGDVTGSGATSIATTIGARAVTFSKVQAISSGVMLGRSTASSGDIEQITVGTGLTLSAGVLSINNLTADRVVISNGSGGLSVSSITPTKLGYLTDVTSNIQAQLDAKQNLDATLTALAAIGSTTIGFLVLNGVDSFTTRVLEGSPNRISINNPNGSGSNPTIDIASTYTGQSSITTLGTITSGVWNGSALTDSYILSAANWNEAYDEHINSITWSAATGNLVANQEDGGNITVNLDGRYVKLAGDTMTGYLTLVGNPVNANHAANKAYVDSIGTGITPKGGANAATTGTLPTYIPTSTTLTGSVNGVLPAQDGVTLTVGQKLLVHNEVSNQYNGLYTVTDVGSVSTPYVLTRTSNMDAWDELPRATVFISGGSTQAGYTYYCTVATGGTLGTTPVTFEIFSIGSVYTAGAGIDITGNSISIDSLSIVNSMVSASAAIDLTKLAATTAARALVSDASGYIVASATTATEIGYLTGLSGSVQTQINGKQPLDATLTALAALDASAGVLVQTASDTFTKRTITGTTDRISIANGSGAGGNPTIDIASTYIGQSSITTVGTIISGTWNGTAIGDSYIASATTWNTAYNNMIVSASFNAGNGLLTLTQQDTGSVTVDIDGRYVEGTGVAGQIAYWSGTNQITGESKFVWDSANDRLGVGTDNPEAEVTIVSNGTNNTRGVLGQHYDNTTAFSQFKFVGSRARGSKGSPSAVLADDSLVSFNARGYKATRWSNTLGGMYVYAAENFTDTATGTYITFRGVATGGTTVSEWARITSAGITATAFIKSGGTSAQFLKADGSIDSNTYLTGNQTITLSGEASGSGATGITVTLSTTAVTGKLLTGYTSGAGTITSADSILSAIQKLNGNVSALVTGVSSVSGTANRITVSPTSGAVVVDIASNYAGQNTITTLGTIGTGVWQGTAIADAYISSAANWNAKIGGSGTSGYIPKFTASGTVGDSAIRENSGNIGINVNPVNAKLEVVATTGEVFRADASFGSPRIVANQNFVYLGDRVIINTFTDDGVNKLQVNGSARVNGNLGVVGNIVNNYTINTSSFGLDSIGFTKVANGLLFRLGAISGIANGFTSQLNATNDGVIYSFDYGNVGIGTASPSVGMLHLNYNSVNNRALRLQDENGIYDIVTSGGGNNHSLGIYDETNSAYRVYITPTGNVLIGTTTDASGYKLQVAGLQQIIGANTLLNFGELDANNTYFQSINLAQNVSKGIVFFGTSEYGRFASSGNLLIGTTTDDGVNKLQVNGSARVNGNLTAIGLNDESIRVATTGDTNAASVIIENGSGTTSLGYSYTRYVNSKTSPQDWRVGTYGNDNLSFVNATNGTTPLIISTTGAATFSSSVTVNSIANATTDTDRFLVSDGGVIKYRTGSELLSDIGAAVASGSSNYIQNKSIGTAQTASFDVSGDSRVAGKFYIGANGAYIEEVLVGSTYELRVVDSAGNITVIS